MTGRVLMLMAAAYLSGGVMWGWLLPRLIEDVDVREWGDDGNPGAFNAGEACGLPMALSCALLDMLKTLLPVALAFRTGWVTGWQVTLIAVAAVLGHIFPWSLHFRGGKGITAAFGALIGLMPEVLLAPVWALSILVLLPVIRDHSRLMRVTAVIMASAGLLMYRDLAIQALAASIAGLIIWRHPDPSIQTRKETTVHEA